MIDIKAVKALTTGFGQYLIYKETVNLIAIFNTFNASVIKIKFRIGLILLVSSLKVQSPVGEIVFYIMYTDTLFFINLRDLNSLNCYYNNLTNKVVTPILTVLVV